MEAITAPEDELGEAAVWDDRSGTLWWADILRHRIRRIDPASGRTDHWELGDTVGALALSRDGGLLAAVGRALGTFDPGSGSYLPRIDTVEDDAGNRTNDGRVDPAGRFWVGTMDRDEVRHSGSLYRLDPDWTVHRMASGIDIPNSICFAPDGRTMYFTETRDRIIRAFTLDTDGSVVDRRVFVELPGPGNPDGSCVDAEGCVWNAEWGGARVTRYTPQGRVDRVVEVPAPQVTCPALGDTTLYVTTARKGMSPADLAENPAAGSVFAREVGVTAAPTPRFGG